MNAAVVKDDRYLPEQERDWRGDSPPYSSFAAVVSLVSFATFLPVVSFVTVLLDLVPYWH